MIDFEIAEIETETSEEGEGTPTTLPTYRLVSEMLRSLPPRGIGVIYGRTVNEEIRFTFDASSEGGSPRYSAISRLNLVDYARQRRAVKARSRYRVEAFLSKQAPREFALTLGDARENYADVFDFVASIGWKGLTEFFRPLYKASKRIKDGADREFDDYMGGIRDVELPEQFIVRANRSYFTIRNVIEYWLFLNRAKFSKMLIVVEGGRPSWADSPSIFIDREREYLSAPELVEKSARFFSSKKSVIEQAFQLWTRSRPALDRTLIQTGRVTETAADAFLAAFHASRVDDGGGEIRLTVPLQRPAPLQFQLDNGRIDLVVEKQLGDLSGRAIGAARGCQNAVKDLLNFGGLGNSQPALEAKFKRIDALFDQVIQDDYDDALIIQIGTEVRAANNRISIASAAAAEEGGLSEDTLAESVVVFALCESFLSQFDSWGVFKAQAVRSEPESDSSDNARNVLTAAKSRDRILTGRARTRIGNYLDGLDSASTAQEVEAGSVVAAENFLAQAAGELAEIARKRGRAISDEIINEVRSMDSSSAAKWLIENAELVEEFAESSHISWLTGVLLALQTPRAVG